jgi:hypothetical protein
MAPALSLSVFLATGLFFAEPALSYFRSKYETFRLEY